LCFPSTHEAQSWFTRVDARPQRRIRVRHAKTAPHPLSCEVQVVHAFIIEDDYLISRDLQDMLAELGFTRFSFARSEDAAVAGAASETFDLISADVRLLPGDGVKAVEAICHDREVPVIFITGYPDDVRDQLEERLPGARLIGKPIKRSELASAVRDALGTRASAGVGNGKLARAQKLSP
jgi:DNA-binding response OmpR family regulator